MTAVIGGSPLSERSSVMEEPLMAKAALALGEDVAAGCVPTPAVEARPTFRLRPIMRQGTASSIPETWTRFAALADARHAVKAMYHDDRVLRAFIVTNDIPPRFVEWVER
jgi:hypothetical protein